MGQLLRRSGNWFLARPLLNMRYLHPAGIVRIHGPEREEAQRGPEPALSADRLQVNGEGGGGTALLHNLGTDRPRFFSQLKWQPYPMRLR
jgi:hypothetical protein